MRIYRLERARLKEKENLRRIKRSLLESYRKEAAEERTVRYLGRVDSSPFEGKKMKAFRASSYGNSRVEDLSRELLRVIEACKGRDSPYITGASTLKADESQEGRKGACVPVSKNSSTFRSLLEEYNCSRHRVKASAIG